jgi:nitroimidazol reductase NimA-like FMN-containing flavoprotein (pyridoxamine 5'-phosphate oxidase superfamily)
MTGLDQAESTMAVEMTEEQIQRLLSEQWVGRLGMIDAGEPYVVPISFAYDDGYVYCHSAQGRKVRALRSHSEVCFEVDDVVDLATWSSVIAWGTFEQVIGLDAQHAMDVLLDRFRPLFATGPEMNHPGAELGMMRTLNVPRLDTSADLAGPSSAGVVFRIRLHTMSGRIEAPAGP